MRISVVAALASNRVIGRDGDLPWHLPTDLRRFRSLTTGHHLLVGRKTWESIGRPLPGRRILVLSRSDALELPDPVERVGSLEEGIRRARERGEEELFVAGGAAVYRLALPLADRMYLTRVAGDAEGDTRFPEWPRESWSLLATECPAAVPGDESPGLRFEVWGRAPRSS